ncbi:MAG: hypothetical protein V1689_13010 [Pseudomonadota bacterium]
MGCGVCAHKCPSGSLTLVRRKDITEPPETPREYMKYYMAHRQAARERRK